jgi:hypothetical protein
MHLKYTAGEGGDLLRNAASGEIMNRLEQAASAGLVRLFSIRQEFPTDWAKFVGITLDQETKTASLPITLRQEHFPFWSQGLIKKITSVSVYVKGASGAVSLAADAQGSGANELLPTPQYGDVVMGKVKNVEINTTPEWSIPIQLFLTDNKVEDVWLAVPWSS